MALFKVFRGVKNDLPVQKTDGYAYFCTDDGSFLIDYADSNGTLHRKPVNEGDLAELLRLIGLPIGSVNSLKELIDTLEAKHDNQTIAAGEDDDTIVLLTGTEGTNAVSYRAEHAKRFRDGSGESYTSRNTVEEISGNGTFKTIKIPQFTVDPYGHVTAADDQDITITLPSEIEIAAKTTEENEVIDVTPKGGTNEVTYTVKHQKKGPAGGYTSGNTTESIDGSAGTGVTGVIQIPQISVDEYGHVTAAEDEEVIIKIPSIPTEFDIDATGTGDDIISVTPKGDKNKVDYVITHKTSIDSTSKGPTQNCIVDINTEEAVDSQTIKVPYITVDGYGHVTGLSEQTLSISAPKIPTELKNPASLTIGGKTYDGSREIKVDAADLGLTGALVFLGTTTTDIADASTTNPITVGGKSVTAINGNVVLYGNQEYMWNNTFWELLGDEGSYALKTVQVIAGDGLIGGGPLTGDVILNVNPGDGIEIVNDKVKAKAGNGITVDANGIHHKDTSSQASITAQDRTYIKSVTLDTYGHVTGLTTGTETVVNTDTNQTIKVGDIGFGPNDAVSLVAGDKITITPNTTNDTITISSVDTHWTSNLITGASASAKANAAVSENGKLYLNLVENDTVRNSHNIVGTGGTSITCDANGKITVNSPVYIEATQSTAGLMSADDKKKLDSVAWSAGNITFEYKDGILTITEV